MTETEPVRCPTCNSDDISYVDRFEDGGIRVKCQKADCMAEWWEVWTFSHIEMIEGRDNRYMSAWMTFNRSEEE